jgi:hypothetical protein
MYDLLARIAPDGQDLLAHVLEECYDSSDVLSQLAAIQFVYDHGMNDVDNFVELFNENIDNPLTIVSIAQTCAAMLVKVGNPERYLGVVEKMVDLAIGEVPDLLGALAPLAGVEAYGRFLLESPAFQIWLFDVPYKAELRTFNVYMRNLLVRWSASPGELLLSESALKGALTNPHPGLRTAVFEHIAIMAQYFRDKLIEMDRLPERVCDGHMDSSVEEVLARQKAMEALGIRIMVERVPGNSSIGARDAGPDLMTI